MKAIHELSTIMSIDFSKMMSEVHPSYGDLANSLPKSISNGSLAKLAGIVQSLKQEKKQRLEKVRIIRILCFILLTEMKYSLPASKKKKNSSIWNKSILVRKTRI